MLWINGPAGYGKTIICARLIQYLSKTAGSPLAYYFFSSESENREDPFVIIRSWLSQVVDYDQNAYQVACERWQMRGHTASRTEIIELFRLVVQSTPNCIFVVDGLDECVWLKDSSPISFLTALKQAIAQTTSRIMILSRDEVGIRSGIHVIPANDPNQNLYEHRISRGDVQSDIELFCRNTVDKKLPNKSETLRDKISQRMAKRCNGMFLWVRMQGDNLRGGKGTKQLEEIVDDAPAGLEHLYDRNWARLSNLPDYDRARAFSILRWAAFALRPLTILELTEALLVVDDDSCDDLLVDQLPDDIDDEYVNGEIMGLCGSLIEIRGEASNRNLGSLTVHLTHFSVKQYILRKMSGPGLSDMNRLLRSNEAIQSNELAKICLRYLNFGKVWQQSGLPKDNLSSRPFRNYAARFWHQHIIMDCKSYAGVVDLTNILFNPANSNWASWQMWFDSLEPLSNLPEAPKVSSASPLYYASLLGLQDTVMYLTEKLRLDVNDVDEHQRTALQAACSQDCISIVKILLEKGADVTVATNDGLTPLHIASSNGHIEVVKMLLEKGANIIVTSNDGCSPLYLASSNGHIEVVKVLLEKGADAAVINKIGFTPQYIASRQGHVEVVKVLLEKGADAAAVTKDGWTLLHVASYNNHVKLVEMLLEKGACTTAVNNNRTTPLHLATEKGHFELVKMLLEKGADITVADNDGWTPLDIVSEKGHVELAKMLLEKGADITVADNNGWTPLHIASRNGHAEVVKMLLEKGADITVANNNRSTPLHMASRNGHAEVVKVLLEKGADIMAISNDSTPLHSACYDGYIEVAKVLLEKGADITVADNNGWTPLHIASRNGHVELAKMLLENGANITVAENNGWTPLHIASRNGQAEVVKVLLEKGVDIMAMKKDFTPLHSACCDGYIEVAKVLLEKGADAAATSNDGWTPLLIASCYGHVELAKLLLEKGADVTAVCNDGDNDGYTPLHMASNNGHVEVVKVLLEKGANLTAVAKAGYTPLHMASNNGHVEVVKVLLEKGANLIAVDKAGCTPLHVASREGHIEVVTLLLDYGGVSEFTRDSLCDLLCSLAYRGCLAPLRLLIERHHIDYNQTDIQGRSAAHFAARGGHVDTLEYLLTSGANPYAVDVQGNGLLCYAASSGSVDMVRKAIPFYKAIPASCTTWSPLHWACRKGSTAVVNLLLENGFCESVVTTTEPEGRWTPYAIAVFHQNKNLVYDSEKDTDSLYGVDLKLLGSLSSNELLSAKEHDGYTCNGCKQVCNSCSILFRSSNRLGYIWCPLSLFGMCRL